MFLIQISCWTTCAVYELVEEILCHLEDGRVVVLHAAAGEDESGGRVRQVVGERNVDVECGA